MPFEFHWSKFTGKLEKVKMKSYNTDSSHRGHGVGWKTEADYRIHLLHHRHLLQTKQQRIFIRIADVINKNVIETIRIDSLLETPLL